MQPLNEYQMRVARLCADGLTYKEIGAALGISPRTAKSHVDRIRWSLGGIKKRQIGPYLRELGLL